MGKRGWENFAEFCHEMAQAQKAGRPALKRRWTSLRALAAEVLPKIPDDVALSLLGISKERADPEENDIKALLSYAVGKGLVRAEAVRDALQQDVVEAPLYFLASLSGKAFGESVAPRICAYWLQHDNDEWFKMKGSDYYDIAWRPEERITPIRMELKASSEAPSFRFQQVRDPRYRAATNHDYDALLCMGVTAATLEFWFVPSDAVGTFIDDGTFVNQHGGGKMSSNTYWFVTDRTTRAKLNTFAAEATDVRALALALT